MKTLVIAMGIFAVTTVVYGVNRERLEKTYANLHECVNEHGKTFEEPTPSALMCVAQKNGKVLNEKGEFIRDAALKAIEDEISDPSKLKQAKDIYNKCHDEAETSKITGHDQALKIVMCVMPILGLIDKL